MDPQWHALPIDGKDSNITGFSTDLLQEIGRIEKINFVKVSVSWDQVIPGLIKKNYEAILYSMTPYIFNQNQFDFSDLYLRTGPVLVVPTASRISSLSQLSGKEIAVLPDSPGELILEKYPGVIIRHYDSVPQAFNDILKGTIDGAIADILTASSYCQDIYQGQLMIATPTLDDAGLRMMTLHQAAPDLIEGFNEGLEKLKKNGTYAKLLKKWSLNTESN
jgi:ABC-type amino acid transport substrate-binding protein